MRLDVLIGETQKGGFQKGGFGGCSPGTKTRTRVRSDVPSDRKTGTRVRMFPRNENRNEGTFAKPPFDETALLSPGDLSANCTWVKPGRFGSFFVLCFLALGGHCLQMLCLPGFGTHANTQNLPHFRASPASIQEHSPPKCLFFMANAKLPNRPGFALLPVRTSDSATSTCRVVVGFPP